MTTQGYKTLREYPSDAAGAEDDDFQVGYFFCYLLDVLSPVKRKGFYLG